MAMIENGNLALEVKIESAEQHCSIVYAVAMTWNGVPVLNPQLWARRQGVTPSELPVSDFGEEYLSWAVDEASRTGKCTNWFGMEPAVSVSICPAQAVPFLSGTFTCTPDDFLIIAFADQTNFSGESGYWTQGPGMVLRCTRAKLEAFSAELRREYEARMLEHEASAGPGPAQ